MLTPFKGGTMVTVICLLPQFVPIPTVAVDKALTVGNVTNAPGPLWHPIFGERLLAPVAMEDWALKAERARRFCPHDELMTKVAPVTFQQIEPPQGAVAA
jgi:hypothetical protein